MRHEVWLCTDCTQAAVNDDYTGLDYYYPPGQADKIMNRIKKGLAELGPNLVPDWSEEPTFECVDCGYTHFADHFSKIQDEDCTFLECPECNSLEVVERDPGEEEFSHRDCDCCGSDLAGARFRFAIIEV